MKSKDEQKRLLIEMMQEDEKNGMYEIPKPKGLYQLIDEITKQESVSITSAELLNFIEGRSTAGFDYKQRRQEIRSRNRTKSESPVIGGFLTEYLKRNKDKHEFRLVINEDGKGYIHALGQDSETLDFQL